MSSPFNPLTPSLGLPGPSGNTPYLNLGISPSGQSPSTSPWFQLGGANPLSQLGFSTPGNAGATPSGLASLGLGFSGIPGLNVPGSTGSGVGSNVGGGVGIGPGVGLGVGGGGGGVGGMGGMGMGQGQGQVGLLAPPTHTVPTGTDLDDAVRVLPEVMRRLERAEQLRSECAALEGRVFREGSEGGNERIEGVQLEYAQTLLELIHLTSTYLVGALPLAHPSINSSTQLADLATWTEQRAEAQFAKREAVRDASKAVVEVLSKRD